MSAEGRLRMSGRMGTAGDVELLEVEGAQLYMVDGDILESYVELRIDARTVWLKAPEARYLAQLLNAAAAVAES